MKIDRTTNPSVPANRRDAPAPWCKVPGQLAESPFMLENETCYLRWRTRKLAAFAAGRSDITTPVAITDPKALSETQRAAIISRCQRCGVAFYAIDRESDSDTELDKNTFRSLCSQLGLRTPVANPRADTDAISKIQVTPDARYIPYTANPLKWHTDGYYNDVADTIRAFAMHCVRPAEKGGENQFFDPEILYILLRDENPDYIMALMHPKTLTVPQNLEEKNLDDERSRRSAPVLTWCPTSGDLITHYTQRRQHAIWREDALTREARDFIRAVLNTPGEYHIRYRLNCKEGVICNNIIHDRSGFSDSPQAPQRLLYRARYRERIAGTGHTTLST